MKFFKKTILIALTAALALASFPMFSVSAAGIYDTSTPLQGQISNERLERIWARQQRVYERLGRMDQFADHIQGLIDRAKASGKDVSGVQASLDACRAAASDAHPTYESMKGIVNSHQGFDENGKVTDPVKARETVRTMHEKIRKIRTTMDDTGKALREAIKAFREANPRPQPTPAS